jgi:integrase
MVERYLASPAWTDLQATTRRSRRERLDWWLARIGDLHIVAVTPELVAEHRDALRAGESPSGRRVSGPTSNRYVGDLSSVFRWAQGDLRSWLAHGNPCRGIYRAKEHPPRTRILSDEEYRRLEPLLRKSTSGNLYSLFAAALSSGAREGELLSLEWTDDHDLERGTWRLKRGKSGDARVLYFSGEALEVLRRLARVPHISKKVFVGKRGRASFPRTAWGKALKDAEIEDFRFHDLRHTAITWQAMTGVSVPWLQVFSGHKTSAQLDKYVHLAQTRSSEIAGLYQRPLDKVA